MTRQNQAVFNIRQFFIKTTETLQMRNTSFTPGPKTCSNTLTAIIIGLYSLVDVYAI